MSANERLITLNDALDNGSAILLGWSVPESRLGEFLTAVDAAATQADGIPFEEVITDGTEQATASTINRSIIDARTSLFDEAERIINESDSTQQ